MKMRKKQFKNFMKVWFKELWCLIKWGTFRCAMCHKKFTKQMSKKDEMIQYKKEFPGMPFHKDDCEETCENCYQKLNQQIPTAEWSKNSDNWTTEQKKRWEVE
jgi:hypothetical protein